MVTALARVEGKPLGIVANNPTHLAGAIEVPAELTDEVMPGSVGLNQHWGHRGGWRVATAAGGARYNDLVPNDPAFIDRASGNAWVNGIGVQVSLVCEPAAKRVVADVA